jgi:hypothetical protein
MTTAANRDSHALFRGEAHRSLNIGYGFGADRDPGAQRGHQVVGTALCGISRFARQERRPGQLVAEPADGKIATGHFVPLR